MVTAEEIAGVAIFASLGDAERERLSRAAADISLLPGEYAAPEGSERALFAVLEGRIEAVKLTDGVERVVGERRPGDVFGEVPITLGTVFPVGFRAAEKSRVMRVEARDYHAVAAAAPDLGREVGRLAVNGSAERPACRGSRPSRHLLGRSWSGIGGMPPAPRCSVSWIATRSRSDGSRRMRRMRPSNGAVRCRPRETGRRSGS